MALEEFIAARGKFLGRGESPHSGGPPGRPSLTGYQQVELRKTPGEKTPALTRLAPLPFSTPRGGGTGGVCWP